MPPPNPVGLTLGDHDLTKPVVFWSVQALPGTSPKVELLASLLSHPTSLPEPTRGQTATTLAIRMDLRVAMSLYLQLGELGRSMGWLPKE